MSAGDGDNRRKNSFGSENGEPYFTRLGVEDAQAMSELENACFTLPWTREQCSGALRQKSFAAFGLWRARSLIAYISFYHTVDELEIVNIGVIPPERRQGFGARMLELVLQIGHKMGMQKVLLEVRETNLAAIALYEKSGFRKCGARPRYYPDSGEDALVYSRLL